MPSAPHRKKYPLWFLLFDGTKLAVPNVRSSRALTFRSSLSAAVFEYVKWVLKYPLFMVDPDRTTPLLWNLNTPVDNFFAAFITGRGLGFYVAARV